MNELTFNLYNNLKQAIWFFCNLFTIAKMTNNFHHTVFQNYATCNSQRINKNKHILHLNTVRCIQPLIGRLSFYRQNDFQIGLFKSTELVINRPNEQLIEYLSLGYIIVLVIIFNWNEIVLMLLFTFQENSNKTFGIHYMQTFWYGNLKQNHNFK